MLLNLDFKFKSLKGEEMEGSTASKLIAQILSEKSEGIPSIKAYDWAVKLFNDGTVEIDRSDKDLLERFVESTPALTNLAKAQVIGVLKDLKEESKKAE